MSKPELYGLTAEDLALVDNNNPTYWWDLDEQSRIDESNTAFEYINYPPETPVAGTTFQAGPSSFTFTIRDKERYLVPHKAFFEIKVRITKENATQIVALNNPCAHVLFESCSYSINNTVIDRTDKHYPLSTLVRGLVNKTRSWINTQGTMEGWALDGATSNGDVNINLNRALTNTRLNYCIIGETTDAGIRNKLRVANGANDAAIINHINLTAADDLAGASTLTYLVEQSTNPGFLKRLTYSHPLPGERVFTAPVGTGGVPTQANGGNLRAAVDQNYQIYTLKLPLSEMFAFCRDVQKVFFGYFHTIELTRNQTIHQIVHRAAGTARDLSHITLDKIELWMPYVKPSTSMAANLLTRLSKDTVMPLLFRPTRVFERHITAPGTNNYTLNLNVGQVEGRPEHIYFFMTHAAAEHNGINLMTFTHNFIKTLRITVGSHDFPIREMQMNIEKKEALLPYQMYLDCCGYNDTLTDPAITYRDWLKFYPIFCFDMTTVEDDVFSVGKSLIIKATFTGPTTANNFIATDDADGNDIANDAAIHIPAFKAYVAVTYRKSGYLTTQTDGIKFISN